MRVARSCTFEQPFTRQLERKPMSNLHSTKTVEAWKPVVGWEGFYEVSDHGRVRSLDRTIYRERNGRCDPVIYKGRMIKPHLMKLHLHLTLCSLGVQYTFLVHILVLEAFVGQRPDGLICCHYDGDGTNNHIGNLRWDTYKANSADSIRHGTYSCGEKHGQAKLTEQQVKKIRYEYSTKKIKQVRLATKYGVSPSYIWHIVNRLTWKHI